MSLKEIASIISVAIFATSVSACGGGGGTTPTLTRNTQTQGTVTASQDILANIAAPLVTPAASDVIPDADIASDFDSSISANERAFLTPLLQKLPPYARKNVVVYDSSGVWHSNRTALLAGVLTQNADGTSQDQSGNTYTFPSDPNPLQSTIGNHPLAVASFPPVLPTNTGELVRVYSKAGYNSINTSIQVPCGAASLKNAPDVGYLYVGGFTAMSTADAGVQTTDNGATYQFYYNRRGPNPPSYVGTHIICGGMYGMVFATFPYTQTNDLISFDVFGTSSSGQSLGSETLMDMPPTGLDWNPITNRNILRRATSIAQGTTIDNDGDYFGWTSGAPLGNPVFDWTNSVITPNGSASQAQMTTSNSSTDEYPNDPTRVVVVKDGASSSFQEKEGVNLHK